MVLVPPMSDTNSGVNEAIVDFTEELKTLEVKSL